MIIGKASQLESQQKDYILMIKADKIKLFPNSPQFDHKMLSVRNYE